MTLPASLETLVGADATSIAALHLCGKIVENIVKNPGEAKYCRANLAGKMGAKLLAAPASVDYLKSIGFVESGDGHLEFPVGAPGLDGALVQLQAAMTAAVPPTAPIRSASTLTKFPVDPTAGLSLKQKALVLQEQKVKASKENAKRLREEELAKLKQDKLVRATDENWKPAAAGVKGGVEVHRTQADNSSSG